MAAGDLGYEDKKPPGAAAIMSQTLGILFGITILACWSATQYAAHKLGYQPELGEPLFAAANGFKLYTPIDFFLWFLKFGHVEGTESAFEGGEWILMALHFLFVPAIWNALRLQKKFSSEKSTLHGSAKWAEKEDIYNATLLRRPLTLPQKLAHALIDVEALPTGIPGADWIKMKLGAKAVKGAIGCYVGAWIDKDTGQYHYLTHDGPEHILAFAPTRSGKGVGLVLPTLLSWPHSALVHDIKGEAWALTSGWRRAKGQKVLKFQPTAMDGSSVRFNPLEEIRIGTLREVADAQNVAQMIVDPDGKGMDDHWAKTGHELLSAALIHILYVGRDGARTLRGLVSFFCDPTMTIEQVAESMLNTQHDPEGKYGWDDPITGALTKVHPVVAESARSFLNKSENERSGVQSTAMSFLALYRDPIVAMNTAVSEFKVDDLMNHESPVTLYLVVPPNDIARLRPLIRLVINQIIRQRTEMMEFADGRSVAGYKHRMLLMLDEFPALGKLELVEEALAYIAGYGLKCFLITQDLTQLYKAYTKEESIISNAHIRIAYAPNKFETAELLSKYTGTATVNNHTRSYSGSRLNPLLMHVMAAENLTGRPLLTADECLRLPAPVKSPDGKNILAPGDMLIMPAGANPIYGTQILYFKDPIFDKRSKIKPPRSSDRLYKRGDGKPKPIPCDPSLAKVAVETKKSELDEFVKADEQSDQFIKPDGEVVVADATAPMTPAAAAVPTAAQPASAPPVVPATAAVAESAPSASTPPAAPRTVMFAVPPEGSPGRVFHDAGIAAPGFLVVPAGMTTEQAWAAISGEKDTHTAVGAATALPAATTAYTPEEIAAMDAEAEAEGYQVDSDVEKALQEDAQAVTPSAEEPPVADSADSLLDFDV